MQIIPIHTPILKTGDDFSFILSQNSQILPGDILVCSSKAVATTEGAAIDLSAINPTDEAMQLSITSGLSKAFCQAVIDETKRLGGTIVHAVSKAILTELRPSASENTVLLVPNAGLDQSNIEDGFTIGWPKDPVLSAKKISDALHIPVIISDSCVHPRRIGVTAFALTICGMNPIKSEIGQKDLFGRPLTITVEAVADQLAVAANAVMGNANQSCPAAIIRESGISASEYCNWVMGIEPKEDLFRGIV
jgi:coenzyme F420-0:L-glutamate ligase/coenzyme F420-1:gamma-L-glutamate ligase